MKRARFIAGARCRVCGASDRIVVEETTDGRVQRCVACGHREAQRNDAEDGGVSVVRMPVNDRSNEKDN